MSETVVLPLDDSPQKPIFNSTLERILILVYLLYIVVSFSANDLGRSPSIMPKREHFALYTTKTRASRDPLRARAIYFKTARMDQTENNEAPALSISKLRSLI